MRYLHAVPILALLAAACGSASGAELKVIANPSVAAAAVTSDELKNVFLATKTSLSDGSHVEPVLLKGGPVHAAFLKQYIGRTEAALETYYRSLVFSGKGSMPKMLASDAEMAAYVARTKGAIGYVSGAAATGGVKVLEVK